jgi:glycine oxidase
LRVADDALQLRHVVRGPRAYLCPKADRVVVGATSEERGDRAPVTAGGVYRLLEGAVRVVPAVEEWDWVETWTGLRPASPDHAPLLGDSPHAGVVYATGHYRHGMLLLPVTADEVAALVAARLDGSAVVSDVLAPFSPLRSGGGGSGARFAG